MTVYSVYEPASDENDIARRADKVAFVKEGFSWLALIFPLVWLLYYRMWIEFLVFMGLMFAVQWAFGGITNGAETAGLISLAISVLFAFEANDLRGAMLERRGYRFAGVASGRDRIEAEWSFFPGWLKQEERPSIAVPPASKIVPGTITSGTQSQRGGGNDVIGLFPQG